MWRRKIERRLARNLTETQEAWHLANLRFHEVITSVPFGVPDSTLRITQADAEYRRALSAYQLALERWTNFVARGITPDDFEDD